MGAWQPILFGALAGAVTLVGILAVRIWHAHALRHSHTINSFAAGLLVAAAIVALMPYAMDHNADAPLYVVAGFLSFLVLESFLVVHSGVEVHYPEQRRAAQGMVFFWGLFLHSLLDGLIVAVGFATAPQLGLLTALAVVGHELPEGVTTFALLLERIDERRAVVLSVAVAVATPAGALLGVLLLPSVGPGVLGAAVGVAAGSFLYIGASDIVPEIREGQAVRNMLFLLAGVAFLVALEHLLPH